MSVSYGFIITLEASLFKENLEKVIHQGASLGFVYLVQDNIEEEIKNLNKIVDTILTLLRKTILSLFKYAHS